MQAAESVFEQARSKGEYSGGGGSGSVGFALDAQNKMREQLVIDLQHFSIDLEHFSNSKVPRASAADRQEAQQQLATVFQAA